MRRTLIGSAVRSVLLAALALSAHPVPAASLSQQGSAAGQWRGRDRSRAEETSGWTSRDDRPEDQPGDATGSASTWSAAAPNPMTRAQQSPPPPAAHATRWISPTGRRPATPKTTQRPDEPAATAHEPQRFVPPADARQLAPADPSPAETSQRPAQQPPSPAPAHQVSRRRPTTEPATAGRPNRDEPAALADVKPISARHAADRQVPEHGRPGAPRRVADRPVRPTAGRRHSPPSPRTEHWLDNQWLSRLRQVAFHEDGSEELYAPPGYESDTEQGMIVEGPMMVPGNEWIGGPPSGPGCPGGCGPNCGCGPSCNCGDGVCEPNCGCGTSQGDLGCIGVGDAESCNTVRIRVPRIQELVIFGGVHGFKGPYDQNRNTGNFGFQEGFNLSGKMPFVDAGYQIGVQNAQSQLSGDANSGIADSFTQTFVTGGAFHRTRDGFQGGIAWDLLSDERQGTVEFEQARGELSFVDHGRHEWGARVAFHLDDYYNGQTSFQATDQYTIFYRLHGKRGGEGRFFAGITDDSDAILGADFLLPLSDRWSLASGFTYLVPEEDAGIEGSRQEAWNVGINLVWHWKARARRCHSNPYRPLFDVADNGSLIIDDRP